MYRKDALHRERITSFAFKEVGGHFLKRGGFSGTYGSYVHSLALHAEQPTFLPPLQSIKHMS